MADALWRVCRRPPDEGLTALLVRVDPSRHYVPGKAITLVIGAVWSHAGILGEVYMRQQPGTSGIAYLYLSDLGPNRACVAWLDLRVAHPPTSNLKIGATGNPSTLLVTYQSSGGQRVQVPFAFTATASGEATVYLVPTGTGSGAYWHGASIHAL